MTRGPQTVAEASVLQRLLEIVAASRSAATLSVYRVASGEWVVQLADPQRLIQERAIALATAAEACRDEWERGR